MAGCNPKKKQESPLLSEKIDKQNPIELAQKMKEDEKVSREEMDLFTNAMARMSNTPDSLVGKTIGEIIDMQSKALRNASAQTLINTAKRTEMFLNHSFKYHGFKPAEEKGTPLNVLIFEIVNNSDKEISHIEGALSFYNKNNQLVKRFNLSTLDGKIPAGKSQKFQNPFKHDPENQRDVIFRNQKNLRGVWQPMEIKFADGESVSFKE
jgi:hypothetical protein